MKKRQLLPVSLGVSLLIWSIWSWPLPRWAGRGIPFTYWGGPGAAIRQMEAGDHLQLLYHFWIFSDMLSGRTPWMSNPYEFHTGDEAARREPGPYYAPFSWLYALLAVFGSRALAYNLSGLAALWLTYLFTWLLVRRYVPSGWLAGISSVIAIILPYRWINLLGGSPTGFGMAVTPFLLWGLDRAVRDGSLAGGLWAGLAIVFSYTSDLHIFLFNVLLVLPWCAVALAARGGFEWRSAAAYRRLGAALLPVAAGLAAAVIVSLGTRRGLAGSVMAEGRTLEEVGLFSPHLSGLLGRFDDHVSGHIFLGYTLPLLFLAGAAATGIRLWRDRPRPWRDGLIYLLLFGGAAVIVMLATGPFGPHGGVFWRKARDFIPHYNMIRQTAKAYGILPPLLALLVALAGASLARLIRFPPAAGLAAGAAVLLAGWEYRARIDPAVCLLAGEEPVYAAVAADAAGRGIEPHILAIPLWPGNSHYSSLYQYYCSLYRIRMVNGYRPAVDSGYFNDIFLAYQGLNQGCLTGEQADSLQARGVSHLVLHEDIFPGQVSPFPHGYTLASLLANPRLELLAREGPVWSFRIVAGSAEDPRYLPGSDIFPAARHWIFRKEEEDPDRPDERSAIGYDADASNGSYLALLESGASTEIPGQPAPPAPDLRWMVRLRGQGALEAEVTMDGRTVAGEVVTVEAPEWTWITLPVPRDEHAGVGLRLTLRSGRVDLCSALLTAGRPFWPEEAEAVEVPAGNFFHRGASDPESRSVEFRPDRDRRGPALYGPRLPLPEGRYEIGLDFDSPAPPGTILGGLQAEQLFSGGKRPVVHVIAGRPAGLKFNVLGNLPFNIIFHFDGNAPVTVRELTVRRRPRRGEE